MELESQFLFFFSAIGALNGFFLSIYFAFFIKSKKRSTYFLAALLFVVSLRVTKSVFLIFYENISDTFIQIGLSACLLIGPFLYLYVSAEKKEKEAQGLTWLLHVLPVVIGMTIIGYYFPYKENRYLWQRSSEGYLCWFLFGQWFTYVLLSMILIKDSIRKILFQKDKLHNKEIWLTTIVVGILCIWIAYFTTNYTSYIVGALSFSFVFYVLILFWVLKRRKSGLFFQEPVKYENKKIIEEDAQVLEKNLHSVMTENKLYTNADLKLIDVADKLETAPHYLSQFLNDNLGKSFSLFVNEYRIEEAKTLLKTKTNYTTEAVGYECGFNSKSTFFTTFKKLVGVTPATYIKKTA